MISPVDYKITGLSRRYGIHIVLSTLNLTCVRTAKTGRVSWSYIGYNVLSKQRNKHTHYVDGHRLCIQQNMYSTDSHSFSIQKSVTNFTIMLQVNNGFAKLVFFSTG